MPMIILMYADALTFYCSKPKQQKDLNVYGINLNYGKLTSRLFNSAKSETQLQSILKFR